MIALWSRRGEQANESQVAPGTGLPALPDSGLMHNSAMSGLLLRLVSALLMLLAGPLPLLAQNTDDGVDGTTREVEESDEAYRRRMELEDARQRDLGYTLPPETYVQQQEKIDQLPEESRDNIRDQLVDIIVEDGEWEPGDALKDYPYEPTAAASADPELLQREQDAWDEQIEKYHKREAAAYGTYLGPVPGPGNPTGEEGEGQQGGAADSPQTGVAQEAADAAAQSDDNGAAAGSAGTYEPYQSNNSPAEDEVSTAGTRQSALEFLRGLHGPGNPQAAQSPPPEMRETGSSAATASSAETTAEPKLPAAEPTEPQAIEEGSTVKAEIDLTTPGIIPIEELDKLEGTERAD